MTGLGDIVRDAGEQAATQGVDLGDFLSEVWDWITERFAWAAEAWGWDNIIAVVVIIAAIAFVTTFAMGGRN